MSLADTQHLVARLATDIALCKRFIEVPVEVGAEFGVGAEEALRLAQETAPQLEPYARSLINKRLGEVRPLLPRTKAALGARFDAHFRRFASGCTPQGVKKYVQDTVAFAQYLEANLQTEEAKWAGTLARFEASCLLANSGGWLLIRRFHNLRFEATQTAPLWTFALWLRAPRRNYVIHYRYPRLQTPSPILDEGANTRKR